MNVREDSMSIFRDWLPADLPARVSASEPRRFRECIAGLKADWEANASKTGAERSQATLEWVSLIQRHVPARICPLILSTRSLTDVRCDACSTMATWHKPEVTEEDANAAAELLLDIALHSQHCLATRMRWAELLRKILRQVCCILCGCPCSMHSIACRVLTHDSLLQLRKTVTVTIEWRPLYQLIRDVLHEGLHTFVGALRFCVPCPVRLG